MTATNLHSSVSIAHGAARAAHTPWWVGGVSAAGFLSAWTVLDLFIVIGTGALSSWLRFGELDLTGARGLAITLAGLIAWVAFKYVHLHEMPVARRPLTQVRRAITAVAITVLVVATIGYATHTGTAISRLWVGAWLLWASLAFIATRQIVAGAYAQLEHAGTFRRRYVIFASVDRLTALGTLTKRWGAHMPGSDTIEAIFLDRPERAPRAYTQWGGLVAGSYDDFAAWSAKNGVDQAVIVASPRHRVALEPVIERLGIVAADVDLVAAEVDEAWASNEVTKVAGLPAVRVMTRPLDPHQRMLKRAEDLVVAGTALLLLSPLLLITAIAIKLDSPGPVFFKQPRHGFNNRTFRVWKFRSMRHGPQPATVEQAKKRDPRVTRVGAFIRKTSIDELPQLINVLRGEMSIVGPRPHAIQHNDHFAQRIRSYLARHRVLPGITGWAAVNGYRGETETLDKMQHRVDYDLFYVDRWSLIFDLKIMLLTVRCLIHPNAY